MRASAHAAPSRCASRGSRRADVRAPCSSTFFLAWQDSPSTVASEGPGTAASGGAVGAGSAEEAAPAAAASIAPGAGGGKFEPGDTVILYNGSLCYEAEVLQVGTGEAVAAGGKKGSKKGGKK